MKDLYTVFFLSLVTFCMTRLFLGAYLENCMQDMCKRLTPLFFSYVWSWYLHGSYLFVHLNEVVKKKKKMKQAIWSVRLSLLISCIFGAWCQNDWTNFSLLSMQPNNIATLLSGLLDYESSRKSVKFTSFDADQVFT